MKKGCDNLNVKPYAPGDALRGFTLLEMLMALAVIALLSMAAQPMLNITFQQLRHLTATADPQGGMLPDALQWLENDVLQMRGDLPWRWEGSLDENSCLVRWRFVTENFPRIIGPGVVHQSVQYRVESRTLYRETFSDGVVKTSRPLLQEVTCLHPRFRQSSAWHEVPLPHIAITALDMTLRWHGPQVERIWPVNVTYEP